MAAQTVLRIKKLDGELPTPHYANEGDAGLDLYAREDVVLKPGQRSIIGTGIAVAIEPGYAGFVQPRSGFAIKQGFSIVNTPGLIDSGYRGEIGVVGINTDAHDDIEIKRGDRIAQLVIQEIPKVEIVEVEELDETQRSTAGFGSSGK